MAINLVSLVSQFLTPQVVGSLARAIGVNEAVAQKLVAAAVPTILASLATAAAAPGGAQRVSDAISNSDPDVLTKVGQAAAGGNARFLNEGSTLLNGLLGGGGLSGLVGALSQYSGAPHPATQTAARRGDANDGRGHRPAGPLKLVGPFRNSFAAQQSEGRDLRRASGGSLKGARRLRIARRSWRHRCGCDSNRRIDGFERREHSELRLRGEEHPDASASSSSDLRAASRCGRSFSSSLSCSWRSGGS